MTWLQSRSALFAFASCSLDSAKCQTMTTDFLDVAILSDLSRLISLGLLKIDTRTSGRGALLDAVAWFCSWFLMTPSEAAALLQGTISPRLMSRIIRGCDPLPISRRPRASASVLMPIMFQKKYMPIMFQSLIQKIDADRPAKPSHRHPEAQQLGDMAGARSPLTSCSSARAHLPALSALSAAIMSSLRRRLAEQRVLPGVSLRRMPSGPRDASALGGTGPLLCLTRSSEYVHRLACWRRRWYLLLLPSCRAHSPASTSSSMSS
jgi:hypothetical protein